MKKKRFSVDQIAVFLQQAGGGVPVAMSADRWPIRREAMRREAMRRARPV